MMYGMEQYEDKSCNFPHLPSTNRMADVCFSPTTHVYSPWSSSLASLMINFNVVPSEATSNLLSLGLISKPCLSHFTGSLVLDTSQVKTAVSFSIQLTSFKAFTNSVGNSDKWNHYES